MSYFGLIDTAQSEFAELAAERNVLILHPQFRYHNALVNAMLSTGDRNVIYVTLSNPKTPLKTVWAALQREFESYSTSGLPDFGEQASAVEALVAASERVAPLTIVLCAFDHAADSVVDFVAQAASRAGESIQFVIDSRVWPYRLVEQVKRDQIAVLPVSASDMLLDYTAHDQGRVLLEIRALGSGQVFINGRQIDQWDGALPRALFFYFIDRGMTTRDEVFNTFWPELSTREATNVFHVTKRKISEILGVDLTVYSSGFYRIAPNIDLYYDVVSFVEAVQNSAVVEAGEAKILLNRAIRLHEREYLSDFDQHWAVRRRDELRSTYVDALTALARLYEEENLSVEALGLYSRAFGAFPQREDLVRAQMRLYDGAGQPDRALAVFERLVQELETSLGVEPSPETAEMAVAIRDKLVG